MSRLITNSLSLIFWAQYSSIAAPETVILRRMVTLTLLIRSQRQHSHSSCTSPDRPEGHKSMCLKYINMLVKNIPKNEITL